nr:MAG TPA: hypothetical protein [Caudoviricetes sp.]
MQDTKQRYSILLLAIKNCIYHFFEMFLLVSDDSLLGLMETTILIDILQ